MAENEMRIGELTCPVGVSTSALGHYERVGSVEPADWTGGRYVIDGPAGTDRLRFVQVRLGRLPMDVGDRRLASHWSPDPPARLAVVHCVRVKMARSSTRVLLLRHAQHDIAHDDSELTKVGEQQAAAVTAVLDVSPADLVVSSPLRRALATAAFFHREVVVVDELAEFEFGPAAPAFADMVEERHDLTLWQAIHGFPGGETLGDFQRRVERALEELVASWPGRRIVACTHSGVIDAFLRWAYGLPSDADWLTEAELPNASITEMEHWPLGRHEAGAPRHTLIRRIGDVAHLPPELVTEI
jgi:broad specificity phosphatase PhoE